MRERGDGERHGALARGVEAIAGFKLCHRQAAGVAEAAGPQVDDLLARRAGAGREDRRGDGAGAADALRVVVGDGGAALGFGDDGIDVIERPGHRRHTHRGAVAEAVVGAGGVLLEPAGEAGAIASGRIAPGPVAQGGVIRLAGAQRVGDGERQHRVVGEAGARREQREVPAARGGAFVDRADNVTDEGAEHQGVQSPWGFKYPTVMRMSSAGYCWGWMATHWSACSASRSSSSRWQRTTSRAHSWQWRTRGSGVDSRRAHCWWQRKANRQLRIRAWSSLTGQSPPLTGEPGAGVFEPAGPDSRW